MIKINLLDKPSDPLVNKPDKEKAKTHWHDIHLVDPWELGERSSTSVKKRPVEKYNITYCSCGKHPVNPKKDVYKQHNHWLRQQLDGPVENNNSHLRNIIPVGVSVEKYVPTYDFSGEDFEMSPSELRKIRDDHKK